MRLPQTKMSLSFSGEYAIFQFDLTEYLPKRAFSSTKQTC
jgi:hypothetical protein